jgi:protein tyrosine phosphatase (PTP) superfamily phosphohydrolase (DUF442 family)
MPAMPMPPPMRPRSARGRGKRIKLLAALIVLGVGVWALVAYAPRIKDRFVARRFRVVDPNLVFASGQINRHLIGSVLSDYKIKCIVSLETLEPDDPDVAAELQAGRDLDIQRFDDPLLGDGTGDIHHYADAIEQIVAAEKLDQPVLIHCSSGTERTNGAVFYYRVLVQKGNPDDAAAEMFRNGHDPKHNPQLIPYLNAHMAELAKLLVQAQIIMTLPDPMPQIHR